MNFTIVPPDRGLQTGLQHKIDTKTKPLGALGQLESLALQLGLIQNTPSPVIRRPTILVFAGDHGIAATGLVNPYPQAVTAQMVLNFVRGGAAINVFCRLHELELRVVDAGVNYDFSAEAAAPLFLSAKIRMSTRNYLDEPAMTEEECALAIERGAGFVKELAEGGCNTVGFGEMGIGNTTSAALIMAALTGIPLQDCIGSGTGASEAQLQTKRQTAASAFTLHQASIQDALHQASAQDALHQASTKDAPHPNSAKAALKALQCFGGYEIAMMTGAMLEAAALGMTIIVDGFITTSALLVARSMYPDVQEYCVFAHQSEEKGHRGLLSFLGASPLLHLGMRLGEGTGAALAVPLLRSAAAFLNEMASFESAGVSQSTAV